MTHTPEVIRSAHDKQLKKYRGQGGIIFTPEEQAVLDQNIPLFRADELEKAAEEKQAD